MAHIYDQNVYHRDLKPANVLMSRIFNGESENCSHYRPLIADFGLSKMVENTDGMSAGAFASQVGTILYMAPEMLRVRSLSRKADVWSFGVIVWE